MKQFTIILLLATVLVSQSSCKKDLIGEGPIVTETRNIPSFSAIDLRMNGNVYYTKSATTSVEISAKQSLLPILETSVNNNRLVVRYTNGKTYDADESIRINVSGPDVNSFELNTSGSIFCLNDIQPSSLFLRSAGSGSIYLQQVATGNLEAISSQSGKINVAGGTATAENIKTSASGSVDLGNVTATYATAHSSGSGDIRVRVTNSLSATIAASGDIYFRGTPALTTHIAGSGHIIRY